MVSTNETSHIQIPLQTGKSIPAYLQRLIMVCVCFPTGEACLLSFQQLLSSTRNLQSITLSKGHSIPKNWGKLLDLYSRKKGQRSKNPWTLLAAKGNKRIRSRQASTGTVLCITFNAAKMSASWKYSWKAKSLRVHQLCYNTPIVCFKFFNGFWIFSSHFLLAF